MVTSVIELANELYKAYSQREEMTDKFNITERYYALGLSRVCANAADMQLPLSVVQQLLKGTYYEQLI